MISSKDIVESLSYDESQQCMVKLYEVVKSNIKKYSGTDSSSVSVETAKSIKESIVFTLSLALPDGINSHEFLSADSNRLLEIGREIIRTKAEKAETELLTIKKTSCPETFYLTDTLENLKLFFHRYDIYYAAHLIPCSIDYPLLCHVPESEKGICYIEKYIDCLRIETEFLSNFDSDILTSLYKEHIPDYKNSYFNLCEPILCNCIGLSILNKKFCNPNISPNDRDNILKIIKKTGNENISLMLEDAIKEIYRNIKCEKGSDEYFRNYASDIAVRLSFATKHNDLSAIFI